MRKVTKEILILTPVICWLLAYVYSIYVKMDENDVYDRCLFAKKFVPSYVKFADTKPLDEDELHEFSRLCDSGSFVIGHGTSRPAVSIVNGSELYSFMNHGNVRIRSSWHPFAKSMLFSYDPFGEVLYMSDDWSDDYLNGLVISNMPHRLVRYPEWDDHYPRWMEYNVDAVKQYLAHSRLKVKIRAYTRPPYGVSIAYRYFVPYMHSAFGDRLVLVSDEVIPCGEKQSVVDVIDQSRSPEGIDIAIGDIMIQTDSQRIMQDEFFIKLTNAIVRAACTCDQM